MSEPEQILPLDGWHRRHGARMVSFAGYAMPVQYEGIIAEHRWTRSSAGLFDVSHMGQVIVTGRDDVDRMLETLLPADLLHLREGRLRYSFLLNESGGFIDDLIVTRRGDHFYLVVNGATKRHDIAHLETSLPGLVIDHMKEQALLALQGPKAAAALARLVPGVDGLAFMEGGGFAIGPAQAWISRSGYTGEDGFEISVPARSVEEIAELLAAQPEVKPAGLGARDSLRLEAGLPLYGHDLDEHRSPVEAGLMFAIPPRRRGEGGFPGYERIARELEQGPLTRRVGLLIDGRQPVREGAFIVDQEGSEIGTVTSGGFSPTLEAPIAMAYVPTAFAFTSARVEVSQRGKLFAAEVADLPFVAHRYHRRESRT
jgi:aminomethyltransferase